MTAREIVIAQRVAARSQLARVSGVEEIIPLALIYGPIFGGAYLIYKGRWALGLGVALVGPVLGVMALWTVGAIFWDQKTSSAGES